MCRRAAFTLIELLVVIAIISTLIGLLIPAVMKARMVAVRTATVSEIQQLDAACKQFYAKYGFYPPSRITLPPANPADQTIIKRMFPRIDAGVMASPAAWNQYAGTLTGDECLVFFLGGFAGQNAAWGFGQSPLNPTPNTVGTIAGSTVFDQPFYNFQWGPTRMKSGANGHPSYLDCYLKRSYAYLSSTTAQGGLPPIVGAIGYNFSNAPLDCQTMNSLPGVAPYQNPNPTTFQIISAGPDGLFGPGGSVLKNGSGGGLPTDAQDDIANFASTALGGY